MVNGTEESLDVFLLKKDMSRTILHQIHGFMDSGRQMPADSCRISPSSSSGVTSPILLVSSSPHVCWLDPHLCFGDHFS